MISSTITVLSLTAFEAAFTVPCSWACLAQASGKPAATECCFSFKGRNGSVANLDETQLARIFSSSMRDPNSQPLHAVSGVSVATHTVLCARRSNFA